MESGRAFQAGVDEYDCERF